MANAKKTNTVDQKPKVAPKSSRQNSAPKLATNNGKVPGARNSGYALISKTVITTYQNSKGEKRTVKETSLAPKKNAAKSAPAGASVNIKQKNDNSTPKTAAKGVKK